MSKQLHEFAYRAFTVIKREGQDDFWLSIGAAFKNSDDSYNVILQALPIPNDEGVCKIVLRPPKDDDSKRQGNDSRNDKSGTRRR
jgi:hypothetical protein